MPEHEVREAHPPHVRRGAYRGGEEADRAVPVLMYHAVARDPAPATRGLSVTPAAFAGQLEVIAAEGFTPVDTATLAAAWRLGEPLPRRPVLITFDDGYEGVHRHALPELARHGFPATVFVTTGWLRGTYATGGAPDTMLDWDQVRELAAQGVEIGGHSHTHPPLDLVGEGALRRELGLCREIVAAELGSAPASFAHPYGHSTRRVRRAVREAGFAQALAVGNGLARRRQGPYALRRVTVRRRTGAQEFLRLLHGRELGRNFAVDRCLTKGYAVVRAARRLVPRPG